MMTANGHRLQKELIILAIWTASTVYKKNDLIKYGGQLYICLVDHTSNTVESGLEADQSSGQYITEVIIG